MSNLNCNTTGGSVLQGYSCAVPLICCSQQYTPPSCAAQNGMSCTSGQTCSNPTQASDTSLCCLTNCTSQSLTLGTCEPAGGLCKNSCSSSEYISSSQTCAQSGQVCCMENTNSFGIWLWILIPLILLVLLGIIFRKKLRVLWFRIKSGSGGKAQPLYGPRPPFPPRPPMMPQRRPIPPQRSQSSEVNDVLKKLKEIGK